MSNKANLSPAPNMIEPANSPLVKPSEVNSGDKPGMEEKRLSQVAISAGLTSVLNRNAEQDGVRLTHKVAVADSIAQYWKVLGDTKALADNGQKAAELVEAATAGISHKLADAILANALNRKEARATMLGAFGAELSKTSGKPTSKPLEPGNTIAKRVSSVTIAAEYAITGELPDKGGNSLPLVGQVQIQDLLADYFAGFITVRTASERIEQAIKDARVNLPVELNADKLLALAGKIETAKYAIADDEVLREAYAILFQTINEIPFPTAE